MPRAAHSTKTTEAFLQGLSSLIADAAAERDAPPAVSATRATPGSGPADGAVDGVRALGESMDGPIDSQQTPTSGMRGTFDAGMASSVLSRVASSGHITPQTTPSTFNSPMRKPAAPPPASASRTQQTLADLANPASSLLSGPPVGASSFSAKSTVASDEQPTAADLITAATSQSARQYFRARAMRHEDDESSDSSSTGTYSTDTDTDSNSSSSDATDSTHSRSSELYREYSDGTPRTARQLSMLVKDGRVLPVHIRANGGTIVLTTLIANYGGHAAREDHRNELEEDDPLEPMDAPRTDWLHTIPETLKAMASPRLLRELVRKKTQRSKEVSYDRLVKMERRSCGVDDDPYYLDDPHLTGERRLKRLSMNSYCCSVINFGHEKEVHMDINQRFFLKHPYCEANGIRLTSLRKMKALLVLFALGEQASPIDLATAVHAVWYLERLVVSRFVNAENRRLVASTCMLLATKFYESGISKAAEMKRKVAYVLDKIDDAFGVAKRDVFAAELKVYVALGFDLTIPEKCGLTYLVALLAMRNSSPMEYFSQVSLLGPRDRDDSDGYGSDGD